MNYGHEIQNIMSALTHKLQVRYAYLCCMDIKDLIKDEAAVKALELVELWLTHESKVSKEELRNAAAYAASYATACAASYATACAANAAYTAYAACAANAACAAYAAANATANAAANAGDYDTKIRKYYELAEAMTRDLTNLERLIFKLEDL